LNMSLCLDDVIFMESVSIDTNLFYVRSGSSEER
jgi:hypothetical protein